VLELGSTAFQASVTLAIFCSVVDLWRLEIRIIRRGMFVISLIWRHRDFQTASWFVVLIFHTDCNERHRNMAPVTLFVATEKKKTVKMGGRSLYTAPR